MPRPLPYTRANRVPFNADISDTVETDATGELARFRVWSLDVWGNEDDGFDVNDRASVGYITLAEDMTSRQILEALEEAGFLKTGSAAVGMVDGEWDYTLNVCKTRTQWPWLQLERDDT